MNSSSLDWMEEEEERGEGKSKIWRCGTSWAKGLV